MRPPKTVLEPDALVTAVLASRRTAEKVTVPTVLLLMISGVVPAKLIRLPVMFKLPRDDPKVIERKVNPTPPPLPGGLTLVVPEGVVLKIRSVVAALLGIAAGLQFPVLFQLLFVAPVHVQVAAWAIETKIKKANKMKLKQVE